MESRPQRCGTRTTRYSRARSRQRTHQKHCFIAWNSARRSTLGNLPYTSEQIIANAVRILMASKMFPTRDFEVWDAITPKTYPALKTHFHEAYNHRRLNAIDLQNTSGALGYAPAQNMYNVLDFGNDDDSTTDGSMITAVQPPGPSTDVASSLGGGQSMANSAVQIMAAINQSIAPAFNQVVQNQTTLQHLITALSVAQHRPVQQVAFPLQQPFQPMAPHPLPGVWQGHVPVSGTRHIVQRRLGISRRLPRTGRRTQQGTPAATSALCEHGPHGSCRFLWASRPICSPHQRWGARTVCPYDGNSVRQCALSN
jgi:hypothetical protein